MSIPTSSIAFQPQNAQTQLKREDKSGLSGSLSFESSSGNISAGDVYENESGGRESFVTSRSGLIFSEFHVELRETLKSWKDDSEYTEWGDDEFQT